MQLYFLDQDALGRSLKVTDVCLYEKSRSRCQRPTRRGLTETPARRFEGTMKKQQLRPNNTWQTCQRHKSRKLARQAKVNTGDVSPSELLTAALFLSACRSEKTPLLSLRSLFPQLYQHNGKNNSGFQKTGPRELLSHRMDAFLSTRAADRKYIWSYSFVLLVHGKQRKVSPFVVQRLKFEKRKFNWVFYYQLCFKADFSSSFLNSNKISQ